MSRGRILLILGVWIAVLPYLGFPIFTKNIIISVSGLIVIYFSYVFYKLDQRAQKENTNFDSFTENQ